MSYEKIVTLYDTAEHAEAARRNLEAAGFSPRNISMVTNKTLTDAGDKLREPRLWRDLFGHEIAQHEAAVYNRTVEVGGVVLTVRVPESDVAKAMAILNAHSTVDVRNRAMQHGLLVAESQPKLSVVPPPASQSKPAAVPQPAATMAAGAVTGEEVIGLAEEQLNVGKRLVQEGTTRIRRFVTETPVEAEVTLHEEHARVIRRTISDPGARNIDWTDKTIEVRETAEEAVVTKSAHLMEEVVIQKEGTDRVKTLRDKVRRQQVEVERLTGTEPPEKR